MLRTFMQAITAHHDGRPAAGLRWWPAVAPRLGAVLLLAVSIAPLIVAAGLEPDPAGMGTHEQLSLPSCGILIRTGMPCATCGMTTAFAYAADGRLIAALVVQPMGAALAVALAGLSIIATYAMWAGISLGPLVRSVARPRFLIGVGGVVILSWVYKAVMVLGGYSA